MNERAILLGHDQRMTGVITAPDLHERGSGHPVVLLLNAGLIHHVGPNRMYVDLSRDLARRGYVSVRFDMSGIGDSDPGSGELTYVDQSVADVTEAMDGLQAMSGANRFVLMGLCTGAYGALTVAIRDERVVGCAFIDGYAYPTRRYRIQNLLWKASQAWRWKRYILRRFGVGTEPDVPDAAMVFQPERLDRDEFDQRVTTLIGRGCRIHITYTRFGPQPYNYESQLFDLFPHFDHEKVTLLYLPTANHTFTLPVPRAELIASIGEWMESGFTAAAREAVG